MTAVYYDVVVSCCTSFTENSAQGCISLESVSRNLEEKKPIIIRLKIIINYFDLCKNYNKSVGI
jgi:hypothetical protein